MVGYPKKGGRGRKVPVWESSRVEWAHVADFFQIYIAVKQFLVTTVNDSWSIRSSKYMGSTL